MSTLPTEEILLRNSKLVAKPLVGVIMLSIERIYKETPIMLYDLLMLARENSYIPFGKAKEVFESTAITQNGLLHECIRDIILSSILMDGGPETLCLVNPLK